MWNVFWFIEFNVHFRSCLSFFPFFSLSHLIRIAFALLFNSFSFPLHFHLIFAFYFRNWLLFIYSCSILCSKLTWSSCSISQFKDKQNQQTNYLYACGYFVCDFALDGSTHRQMHSQVFSYTVCPRTELNRVYFSLCCFLCVCECVYVLYLFFFCSLSVLFSICVEYTRTVRTRKVVILISCVWWWWLNANKCRCTLTNFQCGSN